jgi:hypothetical protein
MTRPGIRGTTATVARHSTPARPLKSDPRARKLGTTPARAGDPTFAEPLP